MTKGMLRWILTGVSICSIIFTSSTFTCLAEEAGQSLNINQAVRIAMQNSLQRQMAADQLKVAQDKVGQAKSGYWPKLTLSAGYTHFNEVPSDVELGENLVKLNNGLYNLGQILAGHNPGDPYYQGFASAISLEPDLNDTLNYYGYKLEFELPLYTGGKLTSINKQAKANEDYAKTNYEAINENLVCDVKKAYYTVLTTRQFVKTMQEAVNSMEEHVKEANSYYKAGIVPKLDVMRAEVKLQDLKQKLLMAQNGETLARMSLNFTMGIDLTTQYQLIDEMKYAPFLEDLQTCQQKALVNRPEVKAIDSKVEMAKQTVTIANGGNKPMVALRAEGGNTIPYNADPPIQVSLVASMKLLDGGLIKNQVKEAEDTLKQAETGKELITRGIKLEVEQAYQNLQVALQTIQVAEKSLDQAQETLHMAEVSYKAGLSTSLERIDAEVGLTQAKTNYTQTLSMYNIALAQLEKAMGEMKEESK